PEGVNCDEDAKQSGYSRNEGADRDIGGGSSQAAARRPGTGAVTRRWGRRSKGSLRGTPNPSKPGGRGYARERARQAPSVDRPLIVATVGAAPPVPHEAGSATVSDIGSC